MVGKISEDPDVAVTDAMQFAAESAAANKAPSGASIATYLFAKAGTLINKTINAASNTITNLTTAMFAANVVDTDGTMAANSATRIPAQSAVVTYVATRIAALDVMIYKGVQDCSANPNYPAADAGNTYRVSVAGKIGGASGIVVEVGDMFICTVDGTASGNQATVGANWDVLQINIDGAVVGPASAPSGNIPSFNGTSGKNLQDSGIAATALSLITHNRGHLYGLTLSTAGSSATFGIAAGNAIDSTFVDVLLLSSAYTKTTSAWAVGSANGSLDTGAIANSTWYHVFAIKRPDTGVVDVLISLSATAPTLPTNYTLFRRIGAMKTNGSAQWTKFIQDGNLFTWDVPVADVNAVANPGTAAVLRALTVPPSINVTAIIHGRASTVTAASAVATIFTDPAQTDTTPDFTNSQQIGNTSISPFSNLRIRTDTSRQIRVRSSFSDVNVNLTVVTDGWVDPRGQS